MAISNAVNNNTDNTVAGALPKSNKINGSGSSEEMQHNFLRMLVAQLKNQDPTNPMENNELTSQLAQISTVQGIEKLNTSLGSISGQIDNSHSLQASSLIGRGVMIPGNTILLGSRDGSISTTPFGIELERLADKVTATITSKDGQVMRQIALGGLKAGVHSFTWDGSLTDGSAAPDGAYNVQLAASDGDETRVARALTFARVNGVTLGADGPQLDLGLSGTTTLANVRQII